MKAKTGCSPSVDLIIKRVLEGRITPPLFILILGFFSSLALLSISLHVYFFNISNEIVASSDHVDALRETNMRLMVSYNELTAPERIIPLAQRLGMQPAAAEGMERVALRIDKKSGGDEYRWALASIGNALEFTSFEMSSKR